jgi:hypothetical protein
VFREGIPVRDTGESAIGGVNKILQLQKDEVRWTSGREIPKKRCADRAWSPVIGSEEPIDRAI